MNREQAGKITTEYMKPVYGFALRRCASLQDAEDLTQEIILTVYRVLLRRDDIVQIGSFVWTAARNALANYYRGKSRCAVGIPLDGLFDEPAAEDDTADALIEKETVAGLHTEIAYLSKLQRRIVIACYFENKTQETIASELGIPLGTVKWHLFEAKKELRKGMDTMRNTSELKFNPIRFALCGTNGSPGSKGANNNFFRSILSQNIVYSVWKEPKTVNEIADCLGVSPVYVESEAEYLAEYGFLTENKGKYLCNVLLDEPSEKLVKLHDEMYGKAAEIFANELYDSLTSSGILGSTDIYGGTTEPFTFTYNPPKDNNFMLWSLIPYISALSGESLMDKSISFGEAATLRPDGGHNICYASVLAPEVSKPMYFDSMKRFCGPCWNRNNDYILWQIDSEWSETRVTDSYPDKSSRILALLSREKDGVLTEEEYTFLAEMGIERTCGDYNGSFKSSPQIVWLANTDIKEKLISIGDRIKETHWAEFQALKEPFIKAVLDETPKQLQTMQKYGLQYTFFSDGCFILHCMKELVNSGKLRLPTDEQKKSLTTLLIPVK